MRHLVLSLGALGVCLLAPLLAGQQSLQFHPGDSVDRLSAGGQWTPCTVSAASPAEGYTLRCGTAETRAKPAELRVHLQAVTLPTRIPEAQETLNASPGGKTVGARYGTREPRTCDRHQPTLATDAVKDLFTCDAEREFAGALYLVSAVRVEAAAQRAFDAAHDTARPEIDPAAPILDFRATFDGYQCRPIPTDRDYPNTRNCDEYKASSAAGSCFRNKAGDWHCLTSDTHHMGAATASSVRPPTLNE